MKNEITVDDVMMSFEEEGIIWIKESDVGVELEFGGLDLVINFDNGDCGWIEDFDDERSCFDKFVKIVEENCECDVMNEVNEKYEVLKKLSENFVVKNWILCGDDEYSVMFGVVIGDKEE